TRRSSDLLKTPRRGAIIADTESAHGIHNPVGVTCYNPSVFWKYPHLLPHRPSQKTTRPPALTHQPQKKPVRPIPYGYSLHLSFFVIPYSLGDGAAQNYFPATIRLSLAGVSS